MNGPADACAGQCATARRPTRSAPSIVTAGCAVEHRARHSSPTCISRSGPSRGSRATRRYRSSSEAERGFCDRCGSTLTMHETVLDDRVQVALGSLDRPEKVRPDDHVWTESQLPWLRIDDDLPRFPRTSSAVPSRAVEE